MSAAAESPTRRWFQRGESQRVKLSPPLASRIVTWALWAAIACGVIAFGLVVAGALDPANGTTDNADVEVTDMSGPAGWAELYVAEFLTAGRGSEDDLAAFMADVPSLSGDPNSFFAQSTVVVSIDETAPGYFDVVVAAAVLARNGAGEYTPAGTRYYAIGAHEGDSDDSFYTLTLPAEIPTPVAPADTKNSIVANATGDFDADAASDLDAFFAAYLAGSGELDRYAAPEAGLRPLAVPAVTPGGDPTMTAPFESVRVDQLRFVADPVDTGDVIAFGHVVADTIYGSAQDLEYTLRLGRRSDRWYVLEILPAIPLDN